MSRTIRHFQSTALWALSILMLFSMILAGCMKEHVCEKEPWRYRKNVADLTQVERLQFVDAVLSLKATPSPYTDSLTYYDQFVAFHQMAVFKSREQGYGVAHHNPTFPPWHRKLLVLYEQALRDVSGYDIMLPYWDWTDPRSTAAVFQNDFMGPGGVQEEGYAVMEGPFRKGVWQLNLFPSDSLQRIRSPHNYLVRGLGDGSANSYPVILPTAWQVEECLTVENYDASPWNMSVPRSESFRNFLEGFNPDEPNNQFLHNIVHDWVAGVFVFEGDTMIGSMEPLDVSPNDPVFFLHHANVDRIYAEWQKRHPNAMYEPQSGAPEGMNVNDEMYPFNLWADQPSMTRHGGVTPGDQLDTKELGYVYK